MSNVPLLPKGADDAGSVGRQQADDQEAPSFRTTAIAIQSMLHPTVPQHKGGEGIRRLVAERKKNRKFLGMSLEYWNITTLSIKGRANPALPQLLYLLYSVAIVAVTVLAIPDYRNIGELKGLQFPLQTTGLAFFLLLAFRTNSSYDRWWEGRKVWDHIICGANDIARMAEGWVASEDQDLARRLVHWALAFVYAAKNSLRSEQSFPELEGVLSPGEVAQLESHKDAVAFASNRLTEAVSQCFKKGLKLPPPIINAMDTSVRGLTADLSACHRIHTCPVPWAYILHLRAFMILWLAGIPFGFVVSLGWYSIIICAIIGYEVLGFETVSVEIDDPFGRDYNDLPLDAITATLHVKLATILASLGQEVETQHIILADPLLKAE